MVAPAMKGAMGNCYAQLGQLDKAASMLLKAANEADNNSPQPHLPAASWRNPGKAR